MASTWTLVYQPSQFSPHLQPTGLEGTWTDMESEYRLSRDERLVQAWAVFLVPADATEQETETGRTLKIAPTAAQKAATKARNAKIAAIIAADDDCLRRSSGWSALRGFSGRLASYGVEYGDREATAAYAADNNMTWSDVCRTQS